MLLGCVKDDKAPAKGKKNNKKYIAKVSLKLHSVCVPSEHEKW